MQLPSNIVRHFLRNVFFVSGSACGGKTTIAKFLSEKHDIILYNCDERFAYHKSLSDPVYQPYMNVEYGSWEEYFGRAPREYSEALRNSIRQQAEIAVVELISLPKAKPIVVDGIFPVSILKDITEKSRAVFLMAEMGAIRKDFFFRDDKRDMLECINNLADPKAAFENVFRAIEHSLNDDLEDIQTSGFRYLTRGQNPDWNHIRTEVELHFGLISQG